MVTLWMVRCSVNHKLGSYYVKKRLNKAEKSLVQFMFVNVCLFELMGIDISLDPQKSQIEVPEVVKVNSLQSSKFLTNNDFFSMIFIGNYC